MKLIDGGGHAIYWIGVKALCGTSKWREAVRPSLNRPFNKKALAYIKCKPCLKAALSYNKRFLRSKKLGH